jgi:hypothetical protein
MQYLCAVVPIVLYASDKWLILKSMMAEDVDIDIDF